MDLWLFAQRKCHGDIRYQKLTFSAQVQPQQVVRTSVCSAAARRSWRVNAAEGITGRQGEALLEYLWWIPEWELTLRGFFFRVIFFRYLMHKWCNSECYLSPSQRCLSPLSHTISSPFILTLNWSVKPCCSLQVTHSKWSFALFKRFISSPVLFLTHIYIIWDGFSC